MILLIIDYIFRKHNMPIRLATYGGAVLATDNSSFKHAHINVLNDYGTEKGYTKTGLELTRGAKQLIELINSQQTNNIQSLDIFCHGNQNGLYFKEGANQHTNLPSDTPDISLYRNFNALYDDVINIPTTSFLQQYRIASIDLSKFTKACKIEIHGCLTASTSAFHDNICQMLSELLYDAGKTDAVVIGHTTESNPKINGNSTTVLQQDYRHGQRAIYHAGKLKMLTYTKGRIRPAEVQQAINTTTLIIKERN